ncbi:MAG: Rieske (2Fe-2S) protein [Candidatus Eremiobacteraeota bacterium]|nr:Rieske (2Fe-2S) protein [Candidatus Eremiobacteraeota bacterium]
MKERLVGGALMLAIVGSALFIAAYVSGGARIYEGLALALTAGALSAAAAGWALWLLPDERVADRIVTYPSRAAERRAQRGEFRTGVRAISRSRAVVRLLYAALGACAAALVVPFRSLGPAPGDALFHTRWRKGARLARGDGRAVRVDDLEIDSALTVFPADALGDPQSQAMLLRVPERLAPATRGYMVYSKLCTHAGCPVALYRAAAKELMCPCHQSVFNVLDNGAVVAGPADHALPRLPIEIAQDGTLIATSDFPQPVGPSFWERG